MARKNDLIVQLAAQTAHEISSSGGKYMSFLTTAAHNFKYSFRDQLLIYAQKPDATACAEIDFWNKHGRWVNRGTTGIALLVDTDRGYRLRHVFDMSDTNSRAGRTIPLWRMKPEYEGAVIEALENSYGKLADQPDFAACLLNTAKIIVEDNFADYCADLRSVKEDSLLEELDDLNTETWFRDLLENSVGFMLLARCGIDPYEYFTAEDFARVYDFNTPQTFSILGAATSDIAEMPLREIASTVLSLYREELKKNRTFADRPSTRYNNSKIKSERSVAHGTDVQDGGRLPTAQPGRAGGTEGRKIWDAAAQLPGQSPARDLRRDADGRDAEQPSGGDRPAGHGDGGADGIADGESRGRDGGIESVRPDEVGGPDEQLPGLGGGSGDEGTGVRISDPLPTEGEQQQAIQAAEDEKSSAFSVSQEDIDAVLLRHDAPGKFQIYEQFLKKESDNENARFLKEEYGTGGYTVPTEKKLDIWYDPSGIKISTEGFAMVSQGIKLSWRKAAKRISQLIEMDRYLSSAEKEQYPAYREQRAVINARRKIGDEFYSIISDYKDYIHQLHAQDKTVDRWYLSSCADAFTLGRKKMYARTSEGDYILPMMREALLTIIGEDTHLTERCQAVLAELDGPLAAPLEPTADELTPRPQPKKEYRFALGDTVYLGAQEYELLAYDEQTVRLFDPSFPIINKELSRDEFDRLLAENPLNDHLLQAVEDALDTAEPTEQQDETPGYDLGYGHLGNGLTVWNRLEEEHGDYKTIAHIAPDRTVKFYVDDLPEDIQKRIQQIAAASEMTISTTQDTPVFSTPPLVREPASISADASEPSYSPRDVPYIFCEWSESAVFEKKTAYSLSEFDRLMKQADDEYTAMKSAAMAKYGTWQKWYDADDPEFSAFLSYDKVKFTVVMPDGRTFTERQDIGDGNGGVLDFLNQYAAYREIVPILRGTIRKEESAAQNNFASLQEPGPDSRRFWDSYNSIKEHNPDSLVLYQVGDFFEIYGGSEGEDAKSAASVLDLTMTVRNIPDIGRVPMCGFPVHKLKDCVDRLNSEDFDVIVAELEGTRHKAIKFPTQAMEKATRNTNEQDGRRLDQGDDFPDIDPVAVRAALAENGIVDGHVAEPEKLDANPFIQQVMADAEKPAEGRTPENVEPSLSPPAPKRKAKVSPFVLHPEIPTADRHEYQITDDAIGTGTPGTRFNNNIRAIRLLKKLESEDRFATPEEQAVLAQYVGWGGLADCFDERHSKYAELKALLTEDEYTAARESTLTAFYTPPVVIRSIYQALTNMGFKTGNLLEPSCGIGNFIGMRPEVLADSKIYGVELDSISGRIAQQLYQKSSIAVQGFEKTDLPDSFFDAAIGNVPFGDFKVPDKRYNKLNFLVHDYFFAKAIDKVRPGGVIAFITSNGISGGTFDKRDNRVRKYLAQRCDLIGAIRLPNTAFSDSAGTDITTDILFLQKLDKQRPVDPDQIEWIDVEIVHENNHVNEKGKNRHRMVSLNRYYQNHPEMVLGKLEIISGPFGPQLVCKPDPSSDLETLLSSAIQNLHAQITEYVLDDPEAEGEDKSIPADPDVRNFSYTIVDGQIYYRENSRMNPVELSVTAVNRIKGLIGIRDCVRTLIEYQTEDWPDSDIKAEQRKLNSLYDAFEKKYGRINSRANSAAFGMDSSYFLLTSLEVLDDERNFVRKADMFTKRTIKQKVVVTSVDTASEALALSLAEKAKVDMAYMEDLTGKTEQEIYEDLKGVIFLNPMHSYGNETTTKYLTADEYLSGNVREKLQWAKRSAELYPEDYAPNVEALERVQPTDLTASEISVRLGSTWLPTDVVERFVFNLLDTSTYGKQRIHVHYSQYTGGWNVEGKSADRVNVKSNSTYGTGRINAYKIIEETLNLRDVRIFDYVDNGDGKRTPVLNKKETAIAQGKQELIKQAFQDWIWKDPQRRERLTKLYNEKFNSLRPREYDGSHINFVGMNPEITLRKHQVNAIAHILYGGNTLLGHVVGAGKTWEMVAAAQESKRLGLCQKSLFVVPNHLTEQWAAEYLQLYPSANILVATKKDFETKNRKRFCGRISTGDYDAIIIGHSQFEKIPMSVERQRYILEQQMDEIINGISELRSQNGDRFSIKQLERTKKGIKAKLEKLNDQSRKDDVVTFEELGVDRIFIDEAHYYKNLAAFSKMRNVGGISQTEAQKSSDLYMKCRYLDELTGGRGVVFATGTPISNTMVELYTMQKYLQYHTLQERGLLHFDAWASTFGETVTAIELAPEGTGYRAKTRFAKFYNLPELMSMFMEVADIQTADMLNLPVPKVNYHPIALKPSELQKEMVAGLAERAEKVRNRMVDSSVDNMLLITNDGRKLALDQRLINPMLPDSDTSKINVCAANVFEIWQRTADQRSTQMVFCDLSTPGKQRPIEMAQNERGTFEMTDFQNVYDDLRDKLIAKGIPEEEIAYIHTANTETKKKELFGKVRSGQIRVLIGSTQKMGAGTNVQTKLVALHHLDCPWRPSDLQQREGRIIRQGNENDEVDIYTYVTENTFDSYLYQLVEGKQKFIGQIMTSKSPARSAEDIDETALSYAEIKALCTGDIRIKEKMDLDIDVQRLKLLKASHLSQKYALEDDIIKYFPQAIAIAKGKIKNAQEDIAVRDANTHPNGDGFSPMVVSGVAYTEKKAAGCAILAVCKTLTDSTPVPLGQYRGFTMELSFEPIFQQYNVNLTGAHSHTVTLGTDIFGNIQRLDNLLGDFERDLANAQSDLTTYENQLASAKVEVEKPFPKEDELEAKTARLNELNSLLNLDKAENEIVDGDRDEEEIPVKGAPDRAR